jgi:hypothetical protein
VSELMNTDELLLAVAEAMPGFTAQHYAPPSGGWVVRWPTPQRHETLSFSSSVSLSAALRLALMWHP